jgi:hypothetical protein
MAKRKKEIQGLGDVIENITSAVGIETCVGCTERKFTLNRLFNFKKPKSEMSQSDKDTFDSFLETIGHDVINGSRSKLDNEQVKFLNELYLNYFNLDLTETTTFSKIHITIIKDLIKLSSYAPN